MLDQTYYKKTDEIIEHYGRKAASLIPIMQDIQAEYRYLPGELLTYVAEQIGVKEAKAYSVATFYENFSFEPKGKYIIKVCDGTACHVRKSMPVKEAMLKELSGRTHQVYTGVTLLRDGERRTEHEVTTVTFRELTQDDITRYIATGEPMDKAGAYGVQGLGALLVERLDGDFFNVMGLPVLRLSRMLERFGVHFFC